MLRLDLLQNLYPGLRIARSILQPPGSRQRLFSGIPVLSFADVYYDDVTSAGSFVPSTFPIRAVLPTNLKKGVYPRQFPTQLTLGKRKMPAIIIPVFGGNNVSPYGFFNVLQDT